MKKTPVGNGVGGDPVLLVKPKDVGDRGSPWYSDITGYADLRSYFLLQNVHYALYRSLPEHTSSFYVAVYNNDRRWEKVLGSNTVARVTLSVRYRGRSGAFDKGLCPNDCYDRGTCYDPWDDKFATNGPANVFPPLSPGQQPTRDFMCGCTAGALLLTTHPPTYMSDRTNKSMNC